MILSNLLEKGIDLCYDSYSEFDKVAKGGGV